MQRDVSTRNPMRTGPWRSPLRLDVDHERFVSGIMVFASPAVGVSRLAESPTPGVNQPKHQGGPPWTVEPATLKGWKRGVTTATASILPRAEETSTTSPFRIFFSFARSSPISTNCRGCSSRSHGTFRESTPVCQCSVTRYVVATYGYRVSHEAYTSCGSPPSENIFEAGFVPLLRHQVLLHGALQRFIMLGERAVLQAGPKIAATPSARMMYGFLPSFSSAIGATARRDVPLPPAELPVRQDGVRVPVDDRLLHVVRFPDRSTDARL